MSAKVNLFVVVLATLLLATTHAAGYVPSTTNASQKRLRWTGSNCVLVRRNSAGSADISDGSDLVAIARAADNWLQATSHCSYMRFNLLEPSPDAVPGFNKEGPNENVVYWVEKGWEERGHDPQAAGITTVFFVDSKESERDGKILDADMELNGQFFVFSTRDEVKKTDVENTVTHEMGHILGLDHPCDDGTRSPVPKDHTGAVIPKCPPGNPLPQWMKDITMYNFAEPGETKKRTPEADDILGVCETYPPQERPSQCVAVDLTPRGCQCGVSRDSTSVPLSFLVLVLLVLLKRRANARH